MVNFDRLPRGRFRASRHLSFVGLGLLVVTVIVAGLAVWDRRDEWVRSYLDGRAHSVSFPPLRDLLFATVSAAKEAVLANWGCQSLFIAFGMVGAAIGFALLYRALVARSRSLERSEATLRESEARCRDFALTSSDWFWETDEKHRFTYLSDHIRAFARTHRPALAEPAQTWQSTS